MPNFSTISQLLLISLNLGYKKNTFWSLLMQNLTMLLFAILITQFLQVSYILQFELVVSYKGVSYKLTLRVQISEVRTLITNSDLPELGLQILPRTSFSFLNHDESSLCFLDTLCKFNFHTARFLFFHFQRLSYLSIWNLTKMIPHLKAVI